MFRDGRHKKWGAIVAIVLFAAAVIYMAGALIASPGDGDGLFPGDSSDGVMPKAATAQQPNDIGGANPGR